jgi:AcrR family transcriptional regulator
MTEAGSLADRKRQLVADELTVAALQLLATKGFDSTTVDEIVAAAGVSRRTFFRYFASKEDVVIQLFASLGALMCAELAARPADEPAPLALRHAVEVALADCAGVSPGEHNARALRVVRMVLDTPALTARFLERQMQWQDELAAILATRYRGGELYPAIAAGVALSAFQLAVRRWALSGGRQDAVALLHRAFEQVAPALTP